MSISKYNTNDENDIKNNKKSSFKIENAFLDEIQKEAEQKMEDVNTLVNQILKSHLKWHNLAKKSGFAYISKDLMTKILAYLSDEQVIPMTQDFCKQHLADIMLMLRDENSFPCYLDALCFWLDESGFNYRIKRDGDVDTYRIYFDMGRKWSLYFKTQMEIVFENYKVNDAEAKMTDNAVILKIKKENIKKCQ
jgi:predicted DNA-binding ribbon-helix-helix protein